MRYSNEVKNKIVDGIRNRVPLNDIYSLISNSFKTKPEFVRFTNEIAIVSFSKMELEQYFLDLYIQKYNAELAWGSLGFCFFWTTYGFACMDNSWNFCDLIDCAKKALEYFRNNHMYIPQSFSDSAVKAVTDGMPIPIASYGYPTSNSSVLNCGQYLEHLLPQNFTDDEIQTYVRKLIFPDIIKHPKSKKDLLSELFGIPEGSPKGCYPHLNRAVKNAMGLYGHSTARSYKWEESIERREEWYKYSEEEIDSQLRKTAELFLRDREPFARRRILEKLYGISSECSKDYYEPFFVEHPKSQYLLKRIDEIATWQMDELIAQNRDYKKIGADVWVMYNHIHRSIERQTIDFSGIPIKMRKQIQKCLVDCGTSINKSQKAAQLVRAVNRLISFAEVDCFEDITTEIIQLWVQKLYNDSIKGNSIRGYLSKIRVLYRRLNTLDEYKNNQLDNPAETVHVRNVHHNTVHESYIPKEVSVLLDSKIDELDNMSQIMYKLLRETGLRFSDQLSSKVSDVYMDHDHPGYAIFGYYQSKTKSKRLQAGNYEKRSVHITAKLYDDIQQYIRQTDWIREQFNTDFLFVSVNNRNRLCNHNSRIICDKVNALIDKYNITTKDGSLWHYHNKQLRKTVAVDLISNGASIYAVQNALGHMSPTTTEISYAEVTTQRVLEKNTAFFQQKFTLFVGKEALERYSEEERSILYVDFLLQKREVEFGYCCKHPSEGTCDTLGHNMCADCPKLITGPKFLTKWKSMYGSVCVEIEALEELYVKNGISKEQYESFREYAKLCKCKEKYGAVIMAIQGMEANNGIQSD